MMASFKYDMPVDEEANDHCGGEATQECQMRSQRKDDQHVHSDGMDHGRESTRQQELDDPNVDHGFVAVKR
jgi:hypothetical protein